MRIRLPAFGLSLLLVGAAPAQDSVNCRLVEHCDMPEYAFGLAVNRDYAYVADAMGGLRIISVTGPGAPH